MFASKKYSPRASQEAKLRKAAIFTYSLKFSQSLTTGACGTATLSHFPPLRWLHLINGLGTFFFFAFLYYKFRSAGPWQAPARQQPNCSLCRSKTKPPADQCYFFRGHLHLSGLDHSGKTFRDYSKLGFVAHYSYTGAPLYCKVNLDRKVQDRCGHAWDQKELLGTHERVNFFCSC